MSKSDLMNARRFVALLALLLSFAGLGGAVERQGERVLFVGNSITLHGPSAKIGWTGNWGMAASAAEKDYVHLVVDAIGKLRGRKPEFRVANVAGFERAYETFDVAAKLPEEIAFQADTVIVAIGENVPGLPTDEAKAAFTRSVERMLSLLKGPRGAKVYVRSCFWQNAAKDAALREACTKIGGVFVDISALGKDEANYARAERKIAHEGVARHPGDRGMQAIAEAIIAAMRQAGQ